MRVHAATWRFAGVLLFATRPMLGYAQPPRLIYRGEFGIELHTRERWLHERQLPRFTRFHDARHSFILDSVRQAHEGGRRAYHLRSGTNATSLDGRGVVEVDSFGRVVSHRLAPLDSSRRYFETTDELHNSVVPSTDRMIDLVPAFRPRKSEVGAIWTDTLDVVSEGHGRNGPVSRRWRGVRTSRIVGDTVVKGRPAWIVRDIARVILDETWYVDDDLAESPRLVTRRASGVIRGRAVVDDSIGVALTRTDTTRLTGWTTLGDAYGRLLRSRAQFERYRSWHILPMALYAAYTSERLAAEGRGWQGAVRVPSDETGARIASGHVAVRDSVFAALGTANDPDEIDRLSEQLSWEANSAFKQRVRRLRIARGDTLTYLLEMGYSPSDARVWSVDRVQRFLDALSRPEWMLQHGMYGGQRLESELLRQLATFPPSVSDSLTVPCTAGGCRLLARHWPSARNAQLRDLSLFVRSLMDPRRYVDSVRARATEQPKYFAPILRLASEPSGPGRRRTIESLPGMEADWREWSEWLPPDYQPSLGRERSRSLVFLSSEDQGVALRFRARLEGRDLRSEFRQSAVNADVDSARLTYAGLLLAMGDPPRPLDSLVRVFRHGSPVDVAIAHVELELHQQSPSRLERRAPAVGARRRRVAISPPDSATLSFERFVDSLVASTVAQPDGEGAHYISASELPPRVAARWKEHTISDSAWKALSLPWRATLTTIDARRMGPFVELVISRSGRPPSPNPFGRRGTFSRSSSILMQWDGVWRVIRRGGSIIA